MPHLTFEKDNLNGKCPECQTELVINQIWDEMFDKYDSNTPNFDMITNRLYNEDIPKYICSNCRTEIFIKHR
jgi:ssDNA-binding Zn-finger/Zn-ribbon topoisomerase 1